MKDSIESIVKSVIDSVIRQNCILAGISLYMRRTAALMTFLMIVFQCFSVIAATNYVNAESQSPTPPYTSWSTAARTIQEAIDAAQEGDTILVTNGIYSSGGREVDGDIINRVTIDKPLLVQSVNGPEYTLIVGSSGLNGGNSNGAIRCVYMCTNAALSGFTLTNGHARSSLPGSEACLGGGAYCGYNSVISNCVIVGNSAYNGGGVYYGALYNCILKDNLADEGGGAYYCKLYNCVLAGNSAYLGGGVSDYSTLYDCILTNNSAWFRGGGALYSTLCNCILANNLSEHWGGGTDSCVLYNCTLTGNVALFCSGGAENSTLYNCTLTHNLAYEVGAAGTSTLYNCTVTDNSAWYTIGGVSGSYIYNCIVYYNNSPDCPDYCNSTFTYSCAVPLPPGEGNISGDPLLASTTHLSANSPCIGKGSSQYINGVDIDGEQWLNPPSMGADEYIPGNAKGPLFVSIGLKSTNVVTGYSVSLVAQIQGQVSASVWDFGDGVVVSNQAYTSHIWSSPGVYTVRLTGYNDSIPSGESATIMINAVILTQSIFYVDAKSPSPSFPYSGWETAARTIQEAIDAGDVIGQRLVLVTNGVYDTGGKVMQGAMQGILTNRVLLPQGVVVKSVNGPSVTFIVGAEAPGGGNGNGAVRCAFLDTNAILSGFTLTNGHTRANTTDECIAGGAFCRQGSIISNCVLISNSSGLYGGGVVRGTLYNCILTGNSSLDRGGGTYYCMLYNCTVTGNSSIVGGTYGGTNYNCIIYYNLSTHSNYSDYCNYAGSATYYSCTTPLPPGEGNITNEPMFVDLALGDLRLQPNSPCINSGNNLYVKTEVDSDGKPRIYGGAVDIGAYEFQSASSLISYAWLQNYGLPIDGSADYLDPDGDGLNNFAEWRCGTNPTNQMSVLRLLDSQKYNDFLILSWEGVSGRSYKIEFSTNLFAIPAFYPLSTNILGINGTMTYTNVATNSPVFYRIGVE